jgi:hypothetical protein
VTERHRRRDAGFAEEDLAAILRSEHAQIEEVALESVAAIKDLSCHLCETKRLGHFSRTGLIVTSRAAYEEDTPG